MSAGSGSAAVIAFTGLDLDGAVAAHGRDEPSDGPAGGVLDPPGDGQGGEHDGQVRLDRVFGAVVERAGGQVGFGHPEALLDLEQLLVGADHELGGGVGDVGDVALDPTSARALTSSSRLMAWWCP
jgi:hypothetical protein